MKIRDVSQHKEIRALVANKITFPLVVLESLKNGKDIDKKTITKAIKELRSIVANLDKEWTSKE
jgi:hypothetical protein